MNVQCSCCFAFGSSASSLVYKYVSTENIQPFQICTPKISKSIKIGEIKIVRPKSMEPRFNHERLFIVANFPYNKFEFEFCQNCSKAWIQHRSIGDGHNGECVDSNEIADNTFEYCAFRFNYSFIVMATELRLVHTPMIHIEIIAGQADMGHYRKKVHANYSIWEQTFDPDTNH